MRRIFVCVGLMMCLGAFRRSHAEGPIAEKRENRAAVGLSLTRGNSRTLQADFSVIAEHVSSPNETRIGAEGNYGETAVVRTNGTHATETNVQNAKLYASHRHLFGERYFRALNAELSHDDIADVDYRLIIGPGLGRYLIKDPARTLSVEAGLAYVRDRVGGVTDNRLAVRVLQRTDIKLNDATRLWEEAEYLPTIDDFEQYLVNVQFGVEAAMTARWSLRVMLQDKYNSKPDEDKEHNDLMLTAGVAYKF